MSRAYKARAGAWTVEEENYLRARHGIDPASDIAMAIDRTVHAVQHRASRLGLGADSRQIAWDRLRSVVADLGGTMIEAEYLGTGLYRILCPHGHPCLSRPGVIYRKGRIPCRVCTNQDPATAERNFRARVAELGGQVIELTWRGKDRRHHCICAAGHDCWPQPGSVRAGGGLCPTCARHGFDQHQPAIIYLITNSTLNAHKVGVTGDNGRRLERWRGCGWDVHRTMTLAEGTLAMAVEAFVLDWCTTLQARTEDGFLSFEQCGIGYTETIDADRVCLPDLWAKISDTVAAVSDGRGKEIGINLRPRGPRHRLVERREFPCSGKGCPKHVWRTLNQIERNRSGQWFCSMWCRNHKQTAVTTCIIVGCDQPHLARGWCSAHYHRWDKTGDPETPDRRHRRAPVVRLCSVDGCGTPAASRGWCQKHYKRWKKTGDPLGLRPVGMPKRYPDLCSVEGCGRRSRRAGWCPAHYHRWERTGIVGGPIGPYQKKTPKPNDV